MSEQPEQLGARLAQSAHGFTDEELIASVREDAFTALIKCVAFKSHPELRDRLKPHFEAVMKTIDNPTRPKEETAPKPVRSCTYCDGTGIVPGSEGQVWVRGKGWVTEEEAAE